ncbi:hypothetical protein JAAARDRAFT_74186 [Jaapia argillacea MUCL 33604]|uniref:F-box domain-containing protein n=1 Tax=Jaapia argillacea MUCL 33604 TaxID=933084 RepID=A0A067PJB0_9AGAM|nr:hypothetical protein JAAARDRAFT_74186 [Jaapia argillacea MUCL 33604]
MTLIVPPELVDKIIDKLVGDTKSLCAVAFVSRPCRARARYHLFNEIRLRTRNLERFKQLLQTDPSVAGFIRILRVLLTRNEMTPFRFKLPALETLECAGVDFTDQDALVELLPNVATVKVLNLASCHIPDLGAFLLPFTQVKHVYLKSETYDKLPNASRIISDSSIESIHLECSDRFPEILDRLLRTLTLPNLVTLELQRVYLVDMPAINQFLQVVGPALTTLSVQFMGVWNAAADDWREVSFHYERMLVHCKSLQDIALHYDVRSDTPSWSFDITATIPRLFSKLPSKDLERTILRGYWEMDPASDPATRFALVDACLSSDFNFPKLKLVYMEGSYAWKMGVDNWNAGMRRLLPTLEQKGTLHLLRGGVGELETLRRR